MLFMYTKRNGIVQKLPALLKIAFIFVMSVASTLFGIHANLCLFFACFILSVLSKVLVFEFASDLKYVFGYSVFIIVLDMASYFIENKTLVGMNMGCFNFPLVVRLIAVFALSSLFFRTTGVYDIRTAIEDVEIFCTGGKTKRTFSKSFTLFFSFIPKLFYLWNQIEKAYEARMGKKGIKKIIAVVPIFISVSIKRADTTVLALLNRDTKS